LTNKYNKINAQKTGPVRTTVLKKNNGSLVKTQTIITVSLIIDNILNI
jgi:hypothetical protein